MKILNLVYSDKSDIKYEVQRFPDGQQNIVIDNSRGILSKKLYLDREQYSFEIPIEPVQIKSRLNNWRDLELIICAVASLRELGVEEIHLYIPYIVGGRSDRKFQGGGNNYIKDVIAPVINSLNFKTVTCVDPHSDVLEACIKRFKKESNLEIVNFGLESLYPERWDGDLHSLNNFILVSPDAGASKKIYKLAEQICYKGDIITCSKDRDKDGKLTKTIVPVTGEQHNMLHKGPYKDFIIIDDICDGGATFINIAKEIKQYFHESGRTKSKIYLIVTHGIFSKGFKELFKYFDGIYCTNSYQDIGDLASVYGELQKTNVKQLNIF